VNDQLTQLLRENHEYFMTNVHTCFPGVVVKYNPKTRRASIQPSLKRKLPGDVYADFPQLNDVPVLFSGTKNCTIHFPLEKDDEVAVFVSERSLDVWRDNGGSGIQDGDPRRFNLMDCFCVPGLQAKEWPETPADGLSIIYKEFKTNVIDGKATLTFKNIEAETDGSEVKTKWVKHDITGDVKLKGKVDVEGDTSIKGATKIDGDTEIKGGSLKMNGTVSPSTGPFCALPNCLFTGAPHGGNTVQGT
jgi:hypothetical protein